MLYLPGKVKSRRFAGEVAVGKKITVDGVTVKVEPFKR
jgi:hypothetical protein